MDSLLHELTSLWSSKDAKFPNDALAVVSTITSYHVYRIKPCSGVQLPLDVRKTQNPHDPNSVGVFVPKSIPQSLEHLTTEDGICMTAVASKQVGNVPRNLAEIVTKLYTNKLITFIKAIYTGGMTHFGPVQGGGPHLNCIYIMKCNNIELCQQELSTYNTYKLVDYC